MRAVDQWRLVPDTYRCSIDRTTGLFPAIGTVSHWVTNVDEAVQRKNRQRVVRCHCRSPGLVPVQEELGAKPQGSDLGFGHTQAHRALAQTHTLISRAPVKSARLAPLGSCCSGHHTSQNMTQGKLIMINQHQGKEHSQILNRKTEGLTRQVVAVVTIKPDNVPQKSAA